MGRDIRREFRTTAEGTQENKRIESRGGGVEEGNLVGSDDSKAGIHCIGGQYCLFGLRALGKTLLLCFAILVGFSTSEKWSPLFWEVVLLFLFSNSKVHV